MAVVDLPGPPFLGGPGAAATGEWAAAASGDIAGARLPGGVSLRVFDAGLACCAVEVAAALRRFAELPSAGGQEASAGAQQPGLVHVLVVAGTVTDKLAPLVLQAYEELPEPRRVLSFGACSNTGGPYWDSYSVTKGADQIVPVDVYVPGCPPRPEALLSGLQLLLGPRGEIVEQEPGPWAAPPDRPAGGPGVLR